jgi:hypothetical protein
VKLEKLASRQWQIPAAHTGNKQLITDSRPGTRSLGRVRARGVGRELAGGFDFPAGRLGDGVNVVPGVGVHADRLGVMVCDGRRRGCLSVMLSAVVRRQSRPAVDTARA